MSVLPVQDAQYTLAQSISLLDCISNLGKASLLKAVMACFLLKRWGLMLMNYPITKQSYILVRL